MIKSLTKHGNSYAMVIDKPILELLNATPNTQFDIATDGKSLVLTPIRDAEVNDKLDQAINRIHTRFGNAMKKLAE